MKGNSERRVSHRFGLQTRSAQRGEERQSHRGTRMKTKKRTSGSGPGWLLTGVDPTADCPVSPELQGPQPIAIHKYRPTFQ